MYIIDLLSIQIDKYESINPRPYFQNCMQNYYSLFSFRKKAILDYLDDGGLLALLVQSYVLAHWAMPRWGC